MSLMWLIANAGGPCDLVQSHDSTSFPPFLSGQREILPSIFGEMQKRPLEDVFVSRFHRNTINQRRESGNEHHQT